MITVISFVAGVLVGYFGYRADAAQERRRSAALERVFHERRGDRLKS